MTEFETRLLEVLARIADTLDESHGILIDVLACVGWNEADAEPEPARDN